MRDETKSGRTIAFGETLPAIRRRVATDLARPGLPRNKVLATIVRLLEATLIRVGNRAYARDNGSFGLTTLRDRHVEVAGATLRVYFRGKSGKEHAVGLSDRRLARVVRRCRDIPGQNLFQDLDQDRVRRTVSSDDVNTYPREIAGQDVTAKDFRTWTATVLADRTLAAMEAADTTAGRKRNLARAVEAVAARLGNTPTICRTCYVHPAIVDAYRDGVTVDALRERVDDGSRRPGRHPPPQTRPPSSPSCASASPRPPEPPSPTMSETVGGR